MAAHAFPWVQICFPAQALKNWAHPSLFKQYFISLIFPLFVCQDITRTLITPVLRNFCSILTFIWLLPLSLSLSLSLSPTPALSLSHYGVNLTNTLYLHKYLKLYMRVKSFTKYRIAIFLKYMIF